MKKIVVGMLVALMVFSARASEYRAFTDTQGRTIEAKLVAFDAGKGKVQLEREGGRKVWVSPNLFCSADKEYMREWVAATEMMSEQNLRISFKQKSESVKEKKSATGGTRFEGKTVQYEVTIDNRSSQPVESLTLKYRYLIEVDVKGRDETLRQAFGQVTCEQISGHSSKTVLTAPVRFGERIKVVQEYVNGSYTAEDKTVSDEDLQGILIRIEGPMLDGQPVVRDVSYPRDLQARANDQGLDWSEVEWSPELEKISMRGMAGSEEELQAWVIEALQQIKEDTDKASIRNILKSIEFFYMETLDSNYGGICSVTELACYGCGEYELAVEWAKKHLDITDRINDEISERFAHNSSRILAEIYATVPSMFNGAKAVEYALKSCGESNAGELCILAAAYARNGQFKDAVETQEKAISKLRGDRKEAYLASFERRLALYEAEKPYVLASEDPSLWSYSLTVRWKSKTEEKSEVVLSFGEKDALISRKGSFAVSK
jgi:hypothetical protein